MCTRVLYETGTGTYIVGRNADWNDLTAKVALWLFPRGNEERRCRRRGCGHLDVYVRLGDHRLLRHGECRWDE
jgi:hypothetical protein